MAKCDKPVNSRQVKHRYTIGVLEKIEGEVWMNPDLPFISN